MIRVARGRAGAALVAGCLTLWPDASRAEPADRQALVILDVPFLSQGELLCGGAAAAMVLRYWGEREIHAEDFASLVEARDTGIRGDVLADAIRTRGWLAQAFRGSRAGARRHLARGRPLIALIEDQPGRYHYVVLLAWLDEHVILHDSARTPFRVVPRAAFEAAWSATDFWTLLVLPDPDRQPSSPEGGGASRAGRAVSPALSEDSCDALVREGIRLVRAGDRPSADAALSAALMECPGSALAARELAGLRFIQSRWHDAAQLAARAAAVAPEDAHTWRLLASSRFIEGDADGALRAWNRIGEPKIDLVRVEGLTRTPHAIVEDLLGLAPRTALTATGLRRARRRLAMLPEALMTRVVYRPVPGGLVEVDAAVLDHPRLRDRATLVAVAAHAMTEREVVLDVPAPTGSGARWIGSWRWWEARPRVGISLLAPVAFGRSGLWRVDGLWERQSYAVDRAGEGSVMQEDRKQLALSYTDWMGPDTRVALGAAFDRWNHSRDHLGLFGSVEHRLAKDQLAVRFQGALWPPLGRAASFGTTGLRVAWRSTPASTPAHRMLLTARAGFDTASTHAPLDLWPGADTGHARDVLLRAHRLLRNGVVEGGVFGRTLAHGGMELESRTIRRGPARVSVAVFGDVAQAREALSSSAETRTQVDVGFGLRLGVAGKARTLRIDVAQGLRDGRRAITAGWRLPWPEW